MTYRGHARMLARNEVRDAEFARSGEVSLGPPVSAYRGFGYSPVAGGWTDDTTFPRRMADVNGDGRADIVGFGAAGVFVALADPAGGFGETLLAYNSFGASAEAGGWANNSVYPRMLADVNGDGRADLLGFGPAGVYVALGLAPTAEQPVRFGDVALAYNGFGAANEAGGWTNEGIYPRTAADVNGDGRADLVGFGSAGVYVSLAREDATFAQATLAYNGFGASDVAGGWASSERYPREMADVNGDGRADIVGFGANGVFVALAQESGGFGPTILGLASFGFAPEGGGWTSSDTYPRRLADMNGDGYADIVGFGGLGAYVALGNGDGTFADPTLALRSFGASDAGGGWFSNDRFYRTLADVNGDGQADIVGFGGDFTYVSLSGNRAPTITSSDAVTLLEGSVLAYTVTASDPDNNTLFFSLSGEDAEAFSIDARTGAVSFRQAADFEAPADGNSDNTYEIMVTASDGVLASSFAVTLYVTNLNEITGTSEFESLYGTEAGNLIRALGGGDFIYGGSGDDFLEGGAGNDTLYGGAGDDILYGDAASFDDGGNDVLFDDGGGNDRLYGQDGNDYIGVSRSSQTANVLLLDGGAGNDSIVFSSTRYVDTVTILGGSGDDEIIVNAVSQSTVDAGSGDDFVVINPSGGVQTITLGTGNDIIWLGRRDPVASPDATIIITDMTAGEDRLALEEYLPEYLIGWDPATNPFASGHLQLVDVNGTATLQIDRDGASQSAYSPQSVVSFTGRTAATMTARELGYPINGDAPVGETFTGTSAREILSGSNGADTLSGLAGDDTIWGRAGDDLIEGGEGADQLNGGLGNDTLYGNNFNDAGPDISDDILDDIGGGNDRLFGQRGNDTLFVSRLTQASSVLLLDGGQGEDRIFFNSVRYIDDVTVVGGTGADQIYVGGVRLGLIDAGEGDDSVQISIFGGSQSVTLGAGSDAITVQSLLNTTAYSLGSEVVVTDFTVGEDRLSLTGFLNSTSQNLPTGSNPFATGHLQLVAEGEDTLIQYDRDGASGENYAFATIFRLVGVSPDSLSATELGYAPDGSGSAAVVSQEAAYEYRFDDGWSGHADDNAVRALAQFDHPAGAGGPDMQNFPAAFAQPAVDGSGDWPMLRVTLPDAGFEHLQMY